MKLISLFTILFCSTVLMAQSGWKIVKDKTGSCQISVPATWTLLADAGHVNSPEHTTTMVISGMSRFKRFGEDSLKYLNIDKVFENSSSRVFYVTKPGGNPPLLNYHVEAPGKVNRCVAQITLSPHSLEEEAKKIALSLSAVP